jgi:hypothetical protein
MTKKMIFISLAIVILIAAAVVGALVVFKKPNAAPDVASPAPSLVADTSKDFGACTVLDKSIIKTALSTPADNLMGPDNMGRGLIGNGDESQTCVYSFTDGGTIDNGFNINHSFNIEVYVFADEAAKTAAIALIDPALPKIPDLGELAVYATYVDQSEQTDAKTQYVLSVYAGLKRYSFTINEPTLAALYSASTAQTALQSIASSVTYQ